MHWEVVIRQTVERTAGLFIGNQFFFTGFIPKMLTTYSLGALGVVALFTNILRGVLNGIVLAIFIA